MEVNLFLSYQPILIDKWHVSDGSIVMIPYVHKSFSLSYRSFIMFDNLDNYVWRLYYKLGYNLNYG